jgi:thiosulfate/3-mercaptopyruvate sulfurtransferase
MTRLVSMEWVADRLGRPEFTLIDPRRPMKYLSGHLPGAINIPIFKAFGPDGRMFTAAALGPWLGDAGLGDASAPVIYDSAQGQNAAMLAWILAYLGRDDVCVMEVFFETWKAARREVLYKPVAARPREFSIRLNSSVRATIEDVRDSRDVALVDCRSRTEYAGEQTVSGDPPGHIPGAISLDWREFGDSQRLLKPDAETRRLLDAAGVKADASLITYCRSGPRAALGYLALRQAGYGARLFDGSFLQWLQAGLPIER